MAGAVALPTASRIADRFAGADLVDAYAIDLPRGTSHDVETLTRFMLGEQGPGLRLLMGVRDAVVAGFGIKTSRRLRRGSDTDRAARIYIFRIYTGDEAVPIGISISGSRFSAVPATSSSPRSCTATICWAGPISL